MPAVELRCWLDSLVLRVSFSFAVCASSAASDIPAAGVLPRAAGALGLLRSSSGCGACVSAVGVMTPVYNMRTIAQADITPSSLDGTQYASANAMPSLAASMSCSRLLSRVAAPSPAACCSLAGCPLLPLIPPILRRALLLHFNRRRCPSHRLRLCFTLLAGSATCRRTPHFRARST